MLAKTADTVPLPCRLTGEHLRPYETGDKTTVRSHLGSEHRERGKTTDRSHPPGQSTVNGGRDHTVTEPPHHHGLVAVPGDPHAHQCAGNLPALWAYTEADGGTGYVGGMDPLAVRSPASIRYRAIVLANDAGGIAWGSKELFTFVAAWSSTPPLQEAMATNLGVHCKGALCAGDTSSSDPEVLLVHLDQSAGVHLMCNVLGLGRVKAFVLMAGQLSGAALSDATAAIEETGFSVQSVTLNAAYWGSGLWLSHTWLVGFRRDVSSIMSFQELTLPTGPFEALQVEIARPIRYAMSVDGDEGLGSCWFFVQALPPGASIIWEEAFGTVTERAALQFHYSSHNGPLPPLLLGTLLWSKTSGGPTLRVPIGSRSGGPLLVASTGEPQAFYLIPASNNSQEYITTLGVATWRRLYSLEQFEFGATDPLEIIHELATMASPSVAGTLSTWTCLVLDQFHRVTQLPPTGPERHLNETLHWERSDIYDPSLDRRLAKWSSEFLRGWSLLCTGKIDRMRLASFASRPGDTREWARGYVFDLTGPKPVRMYRRQAPHFVTLASQAKYVPADFYDTVVAQLVDSISLATGRNPKHIVSLRPHWQSWQKYREFGVANVLEEVGKDYVTLHKWLPFYPYHTIPFSVEDSKPNRLRQCSDDSFGEGASSNNDRTPTWLMAKLRFAALDVIVALIVSLLKKCWEMRSSFAPTAVLWIGVVDLMEAYRQLSVDTSEVWASGFVFPDFNNTLRFGVDRRYGFGGSQFPMNFCRMTSFNVCVIHEKLSKELVCPLPLQQDWHAHIMSSDFSLRDGILPKQMHGRKLSYAERLARGDELVPTEVPLDLDAVDGPESSSRRQARVEGLSHPRPVLLTKQPLSPYSPRDTAAVVAHIDDHLLALIAPARAQVAAEAIRETVVKGTFAAENLPVDSTERARKKDAEGAMAQHLKFLGIMWDLTDVYNPTIGIPPSRIAKLQVIIDDLVMRRPSHIDRKTVLSLAGKLVNVACVVNRGRIHVCGVFGAISSSYGQAEVRVTRWMLDNLSWWKSFFAAGAPPCSLLVHPPHLDYVPTTDASGTGYGGQFLGNDGVIYYFYGEWLPEHRVLFDEGVLDINILELVTVELLLEQAGPHIVGQSFTLRCDNESSVELLNSHRARRYASGLVLARIDLLLATYGLDVKFEWISTRDNVLADWLSRMRLQDFMNRVRQDHPDAVLQELTLHPEMAAITRVVHAVSCSQRWQPPPRTSTDLL
jgi:hypothetical protein